MACGRDDVLTEPGLALKNVPYNKIRHYKPTSPILLISSNSSKPPSLKLTQNLRPLHLPTAIKEHRSNSLHAMNRLVLVLLAQHTIDSLLVTRERHVLEVAAHDARARDATVVVEVLLDDVAVLREDAVGVAVAGEVVDGEEDVVFELEGAFGCLA